MNGLLNGLLTPSIPPTSSDKVTASRPNRGGGSPYFRLRGNSGLGWGAEGGGLDSVGRWSLARTATADINTGYRA
jgi:hypothetical protein